MGQQRGVEGGGGRIVWALAVLWMLGGVGLRAQAMPRGTTSAPVVDSAAAGPVTAPPVAEVDDSAAEASPVSASPKGVYVPAHAELAVRLHQAVDSGHVRNGDMIEATLAAPVKLSNGRSMPAGTRVGVTVLAVAAAGMLQSRGELTLQVTHVGTVSVISEAETFFGQDGYKELADSAPAKGTEAAVDASTTLRFHVPGVAKP